MSTGYDIEQLLLRRLQGLATDEENHRITAWAAQAPENRVVLERLETEGMLKEDLDALLGLVDAPEGEARLQRMSAHIKQAVSVGNQRSIRQTNRFTWRRYVAAAAILVIVSAGGYYYQTRLAPATEKGSQRIIADIQPGGNRAILTLPDGRSIDLSEAQAGIVIGDGITYLDGSSVISEQVHPSTRSLTLTTPKGGTYQITLPDGTKVWLNSASTLKYPSRFSGDERVVELEGEAYFEVSEVRKLTNESGSRTHKLTGSQKIPFKVTSNGQIVEVLGTQFNVAAYPDESEVKTTLVEGSVRVVSTTNHQSPVMIKPGEQATNRGATIEITTVDTDQYIAWKNGRFYFKRTPLEEIMRQVSRWYDVEVVYQHGIPKETFSGKVSRNVSLMGLLNILQVSAVKIRLEGNRLIVN
ncbi:FecR family protein [Parapedobacter tibetensis]|uniref:FecR family protein n=1 Tax=Parapedobacter tibetensis TaxID=2972951 RepID=UPI00214D54BB|nr:FecR family protein [Parapedobacter tibetensis]